MLGLSKPYLREVEEHIGRNEKEEEGKKGKQKKKHNIGIVL